MTSLKWSTYSELSTQLSNIEIDWLFNQGSLTKRLVELSDNQFSLEILSEKTQKLRQDECDYLNISSSSQQSVREVLLKGKEIPWVYARSIILCNNIDQNDTSILINIGTNPLGSILFEKDQFDRSVIEVTKYPANLLSFEHSDNDLWARRSKFNSDTHIVLVQEIFLSDIWRVIQSIK
ncbi:4-hydroxybenzoate synthetase (chorismate-pyruvate lyase) (UbiC) (PDB:1FW9) [Commensalibacter communis]|uniref:Probable chorismate pyruvate-lyase n=2 Tax=Commensalibacter communis TaxID=2972786 RepID=A0A9W4X8P2_9PROT|nr:chorismate lyase [Commensalibacter communis]CAI3924068.1 4-hydroxybenzoate synthetase (chorismate-pyruvate lyase) (UbiC) (PDB:1FW9) [Commensalibacter communis]CAI3925529.1 4-hydroxybenzoate synthetase (chorismate-pyruvate lyase) (UbiC) (PDB:1FW9) [Commensalibacter communis]CAI3929169.1 4-hydroxybenzoate synthetase (chorismate-pyruvate lyase) (UbiC) (PDB:1FW9) [Commensalibacter communis]CAI3936895.1 4-hydroxybenzoate synthetase (chorismate-pyruvate lyase) (UbiC) (PDB:1FW9) [Commensalibacter c